MDFGVNWVKFILGEKESGGKRGEGVENLF
jgi:hypothetical protein